jgi:uncharacterized protein (TIGR03437 family)
VEAAPAIFAVVHSGNFQPVDWDNPTRPAEALSIFCTGLGRIQTNGTRELTNRPQVLINGAEAELLYAGAATGLTGVGQINVRVPDAPCPSWPYAGCLQSPLWIVSNSVASNTVMLAVHLPQ